MYSQASVISGMCTLKKCNFWKAHFQENAISGKCTFREIKFLESVGLGKCTFGIMYLLARVF